MMETCSQRAAQQAQKVKEKSWDPFGSPLTPTVTEIHPMTYGQGQGYRFFINQIIFIFPCPLHAIAFKSETYFFTRLCKSK